MAEETPDDEPEVRVLRLLYKSPWVRKYGITEKQYELYLRKLLTLEQLEAEIQEERKH